VSSDFSTPPLSEQPMMLKIKDVYNQVIRLRLDPTKRDVELFRNDYCVCTIGHVGEAFKPIGFLCSFTATVGTYMLGQKYKNSDKFVVPYSVCVSIFLSDGYYFILSSFISELHFLGLRTSVTLGF
jgi:hypothetical protein